MHRVARLSFFLLVIASRAEAQLQSVTIRVKDQAGQQIPGSKVVVDGMGTFDTGGIVPLLPGSQVIDVWPGINALPQSELVRRETVTIVAGQTVLDFEWITTNVTIHLRDQHGVEIPSSRATIAGVGGLPYTLTPFAITLPITDPGTYPTAGGNAAEGANNGYDVQLVPVHTYIHAYIYTYIHT